MDKLGAAASVTPQMRAVFDTLRAVAPLHRGILLRGELGSGRRTLARAVHELSRPNDPFVVVDVAAIPSQLLESVLFGHEYSTFIGAQVVKRGAFESASSGTVLLHGVAGIPYDLQPKVLRVFERREFRRVGSSQMRSFTGRILSTTHCALDDLVATHWFRGELLAAIGEDADLTLPPLRERTADLPAMLSLDPVLVERLQRLPWRGNFGQLEAFKRTLVQVPAVDAVTELELLHAIEESPDDDAPRLVLGDLLSRRGDPRGELIQVQCRLAQSPGDRKLRAAERGLLEAHHKTWERVVVEVASTPVIPSQATFERGFVDKITIEADAVRRFDAVVRAARLLTRITVHGDLGSNTWVSPLLRRLRGLEVSVPLLGAPAVSDLARCRYLTGLRSLSVSSGSETPSPDDPELRQLGIEALATSPHLAGVTGLSLRSFQLSSDNLATLLGDQARWQLTALALIDAALHPDHLATLVATPGIRRLVELDITGSPIHLAAARVLAGAALTNLTTLRMSRIDDAARDLLLASPGLRSVMMFDGSQQMIRSGS